MSTFDYPRIHFKGLTSIDVGTGNNDDYSSYFFSEGENAGLPVRQSDSSRVQPETYCMNDAEFSNWMKTRLLVYDPSIAQATQSNLKAHKGASPGFDNQGNYYLIPGEWNYFGGFDLVPHGVEVVGVDHGAGVQTDDPLVGASVNFASVGPDGTYMPTDAGKGLVIDTNPEGVTATVMFLNALTIAKGDQGLINGQPKCSATRFINFQRSVVLNGPNGAAGTFQHPIPMDSIKGWEDGESFLSSIPATNSSGQALKGLILKYTLYRAIQPINTFKYEYEYQEGDYVKKDPTEYEQYLTDIETLYTHKGHNPDWSMFQGTIAPWYEGDVETSPEGRLLDPAWPFHSDIQGDLIGNTGPTQEFQLAPAFVKVNTATAQITLDLSTALPDNYTNPTFDNTATDDAPKYNFGDLEFKFTYQGSTYPIGTIAYTDTETGDQQGWMWDFPLGCLPEDVQNDMEKGDFVLYSSQAINPSTGQVEGGNLSVETEYFIVTDQPSPWTEQNPVGGATSKFFNWNGDDQNVSFRVFQKGAEITEGTLTLYEYDVTPNQRVEPLIPSVSHLEIGEPIAVSVAVPGVRFFTANFGVLPSDPIPYYGNLSLMTVPQFNLRILPNYENYDQYYIDPKATEPVGNDTLTWDVLYRLVLRNYSLLYPIMDVIKNLADPALWNDAYQAQQLMARVSRSNWMSISYMPRTRDLSASRRTLIQAWCRKIINGNFDPGYGPNKKINA